MYGHNTDFCLGKKAPLLEGEPVVNRKADKLVIPKRIEEEDFSLCMLVEHRQQRRGKSEGLARETITTPQVAVRRELWHVLNSFAESISEPWIVAGAFNSILDGSKRIGGMITMCRGCKWFESLLFNGGLRDLGACSPKFTWSRGNLSQRLDRAISNSAWDSFVPHCLVYYLHLLKSDNRPLLVSFTPEHQRGTKPFRFILGWLLYAEFKALVGENWINEVEVRMNWRNLKR
ncbi:hypothetical protein J1N35_008105 [Gossypium stocksii]|uniref:Reverse transcriptase zinc-binding domain-containing protein n=1 Tax=Gossypium stocksii TaxID=47602 RepID=A0A9D3W871_9ROSI|nr:hypothetical protein J1N35_008105 [Gossypium stocksii]